MPHIRNAMPPREPDTKREPAEVPPVEAAEEPQAPQAGGEQATPQEQDAYERVVLAGMKVLYDDQTHGGIVQMLQSGGPPDQVLAETVAMIVQELDKKSGNRIPQAVLLPAAAELMDLTAELAETVGVFQVDENVMKSAMQRLIVNLVQQYGAGPEEVQALMQQVGPQAAQQMASQFGAAGGGMTGEANA